MKRYKILHIPSGMYLKSPSNSDLLFSLIEAQVRIHTIELFKGDYIWNRYNDHIGSAYHAYEFEIIEERE